MFKPTITFCSILLLITSSLFSQTQVAGFDYNWANYPAGEFGTLPITFDTTGIRSIEHAPAAYVHPRIFFGPSEIPEIQGRMANTTSGQAVTKQIHAYTKLIHKGYVAGGYNHNASYGSDAFGNRYIDNAGYWDSHEYYYKLIAQDPTALDGTDLKRKSLMASVMACETYECLIKAGQTDPDTGLDYDDRAADLGTAMAYWATLVLNAPILSHYARFECPDGLSTFSLHQIKELPKGEGIYVYFECDNLDEKVNELKGEGISFELEPTDQNWLWREARLKDIDGNQLILYFAGENRLNPPW